MEFSQNIETALFELGMARESHSLATEWLHQMQKSRAARFEELRNSHNNPAQRESYETAVQREREAESNVRLATDTLRKKQSNYDKLKQRSAAKKKAQKKTETREQKRSKQEKKNKEREKEKIDDEEKSDENEENEGSDENEETNKDENKESKYEPRGRDKFLRDGYYSSPPENRGSPSYSVPTRLALPSAWKMACEQALSDRSQMNSFPDPPYKGCRDRSCILTRNQRALKACRCNIVEAFMRDPEYPECMKAERLKWHPDKFAVCPESLSGSFQGKAREIFVVADFLYKRDGKAE